MITHVWFYLCQRVCNSATGEHPDIAPMLVKATGQSRPVGEDEAGAKHCECWMTGWVVEMALSQESGHWSRKPMWFWEIISKVDLEKWRLTDQVAFQGFFDLKVARFAVLSLRLGSIQYWCHPKTIFVSGNILKGTTVCGQPREQDPTMSMLLRWRSHYVCHRTWRLEFGVVVTGTSYPSNWYEPRPYRSGQAISSHICYTSGCLNPTTTQPQFVLLVGAHIMQVTGKDSKMYIISYVKNMHILCILSWL